MNKYNIVLQCKGQKYIFNSVNFKTMAEEFLSFAEEIQNGHIVCESCGMFYDGIKVSCSLQSVIMNVITIGDFPIWLTKAKNAGGKIVNCSYYELKNKIDSLFCGVDLKILYVVGSNNRVYVVFPDIIEKEKQETFVNTWTSTVKNTQTAVGHITNNKNNEIQKDKKIVDGNWMESYYVSTEVEAITKLIDSNPTEAKKRLKVMEYMLSSKKDLF